MSRIEELEQENARLRAAASDRDARSLSAIFGHLDEIKTTVGGMAVQFERLESGMQTMKEDVGGLKATVFGTPGKRQDGLEAKVSAVEAWKMEAVGRKNRTWAMACSALLLAVLACLKDWLMAKLGL